MANKNSRSLSSRKEFEPNLFESISEAAYTMDSKKSLKQVANDFLLKDANILGTASFYDFIKPENSPHKVHVCNGSACLTSGTQNAVLVKLKNHFHDSEIGHVACLGHCHTNAAFLLHNQTFSLHNNLKVEDILSEKVTSNNTYFVGGDFNNFLTEKIDNLPSFYAFAGLKNPTKVIQELKISQLRGRGGAGFPFWFKLDAVTNTEPSTEKQKYIVCNADEGDPGAYSDLYLLEKQPHKVLFGMYLSGLTVGADTGILYIRGEYPNAIKTISKAIKILDQENLTPNFRWKIIKGQGAYVCGEETALLNSIEGLRPEVRVRPPYPTQYGLFGKPTVLSNVETFANLHWIIEKGGLVFANIGTKLSKGTKLVSLDSHFNRPGVYEITMGTPVNDIINLFGLGFKNPIKAIQIGGPLGGIVPIHKLAELTLDFESFNAAGFLLGHAGFVCIPNDFPIITYLKHLFKFTADESCGKCFPCRIGSQRGFEMLEKVQTENYKIDRQLFNDLLVTLEKGSLCALGGGLPLPIRNAMQYFEKELEPYFLDMRYEI